MSTLKITAYLILIFYEIELGRCCTQSPIITGYSFLAETSLSMLNLTWLQPGNCCKGCWIIQYQLQFLSCPESLSNDSNTDTIATFTGSNETSALVAIPALCVNQTCHVRLRAETSTCLFTSYSYCVLLDHQILNYENHIAHYNQSVCTPIQGTCSQGSVPLFVINNVFTAWPRNHQQYYITMSHSPTQNFRFCFNNVTEHTTFLRFCYQRIIPDCSPCFSEFQFSSRSEIFVPHARSKTESTTTLIISKEMLNSNKLATITCTATINSMTVVPIDSSRSITSHPGSGYKVNKEHIIIGAIVIGTFCSIIGLPLIAISTVLFCHRNRIREGCIPGLNVQGKGEINNKHTRLHATYKLQDSVVSFPDNPNDESALPDVDVQPLRILKAKSQISLESKSYSDDDTTISSNSNSTSSPPTECPIYHNTQ